MSNYRLAVAGHSTVTKTCVASVDAATAPGATYRHTARELLALAAWRANDAAATRQWLDMIANDGETPASMRSRACSQVRLQNCARSEQPRNR